MEDSILVLSKATGKKELRLRSIDHRLIIRIGTEGINLNLDHVIKLYDAIQDYFGEEVANSDESHHAANNWRLLSRFDWTHLAK